MLIAGADLPLSFSPHHGAADEHTVGAAVVLCEYCLVLTPRSVVARKALAGPLRVVTNAAARAITSLFVAVTKEHVRPRGAFEQRAVRTAGSNVTDATGYLHCIPWCRIRASSLPSELLLRVADAATAAVIRAACALTSDAFIVKEAFAFASLAVACTNVGTLHRRMRIPCCAFGARPQRTVITSPCWIAVRVAVALAAPRAVTA